MMSAKQRGQSGYESNSLSSMQYSADEFGNNESERKSGKRRDGLRKGKWTPEEERFANRIIEAFNSGLLKLSEQEKGITLRAYLASKLDCDPMRITKKYTGASCLGKKVHHVDAKANSFEGEAVKRELEALETQFRHKLDQINKKRHPEEKAPIESSKMVSTPAIDAIFQGGKTAPPSVSQVPPSQHFPQSLHQQSTIPSLYPQQLHTASSFYGHQQGFPSQPYPYPGMGFYNPFYYENQFPSPNATVPPANALHSTQRYPPQEDYLRLQQIFQHPAYYHAFLAQQQQQQQHQQQQMQMMAGFHADVPSHYSGYPLAAAAVSSSPPGVLKPAEAVVGEAALEVELEASSSIGRKRNYHAVSPSSAAISDEVDSSKQQRIEEIAVLPPPSSSLSAQQPAQRERQNSISTTTSLMGIISQLQKISSRDNLLEFFEKPLTSAATVATAAVAATTNALSSTGSSEQSPPAKLSSSKSVDNLVKLLSPPTIVIGQ